jgi:hypothetical protein
VRDHSRDSFEGHRGEYWYLDDCDVEEGDLGRGCVNVCDWVGDKDDVDLSRDRVDEAADEDMLTLLGQLRSYEYPLRIKDSL